MFDKGIDYDKAKIIVALFGEIKENEKMTVKEVAQKHQEAKIASEVALEQKIQKLEDELKEIWNVLINEINLASISFLDPTTPIASIILLTISSLILSSVKYFAGFLTNSIIVVDLCRPSIICLLPSF